MKLQLIIEVESTTEMSAIAAALAALDGRPPRPGREPGEDDDDDFDYAAGRKQEPPRSYTPPKPQAQPAEAEEPPQDGRQLLGWAANQEPDAKSAVLNWGRKHKLPTRILEWPKAMVMQCWAELHLRKH